MRMHTSGGECFAAYLGGCSRMREKDSKMVALEKMGYPSFDCCGDRCRPEPRFPELYHAEMMEVMQAIMDCNFVVVEDDWHHCPLSAFQLAVAVSAKKHIYQLESRAEDERPVLVHTTQWNR